MAKLFGFSIEDNEPQSSGIVSPIPPSNEDGNDHYLSSGFFGQYVDIEGAVKDAEDFYRPGITKMVLKGQSAEMGMDLGQMFGLHENKGKKQWI